MNHLRDGIKLSESSTLRRHPRVETRLGDVPRIGLEGAYPYFDHVQLRLRRALKDKQLAKLDSLCGKPCDQRGGRFDGDPSSDQVRLQLKQPSKQAFHYLEAVQEQIAFVNRVEFAIEFIVEGDPEADALHDFLTRCAVQKCHGKHRTGRYKDTLYNSSGGWVRNSFAIYSDRPSKVTGEWPCVKFEWRTCGVSALRALGIVTVSDLAKFEFVPFFRERLRWRLVDVAQLGRAHLRVHTATTRRSPMIKDYGHGIMINFDMRVGDVLARSIQRFSKNDGNPIRPVGAAQDIIDVYGSQMSLRSVLKPISIYDVLPDLFL